MLYRIAVLGKDLLPIVYRRPFTGSTELDPTILATISNAIQARADFVTTNEIYSVRSVGDLYAVVSHDGDDVGVDQVSEGVSEYLESGGRGELLYYIRRRLKPSPREIVSALNVLEPTRPRPSFKYQRPKNPPDEERMRKHFLSGELDKVALFRPSNDLEAAMFAKTAIMLETFPAGYPRVPEDSFAEALNIILDGRLRAFLEAMREHVRGSERTRVVEIYRKYEDHFLSLAASDAARAGVVLYPVGDPELYEIIANYGGYRGTLAGFYASLRELTRKKSVAEMLAVRPSGSGLERLLSLVKTAFARDLSRYIARLEEADELRAEVPLIAKRFSELVDLASAGYPIPVSMAAYGFTRFASHVYRLSAIVGGSSRAFSGMRRAIDRAMKFLADQAVSGILRGYNFAMTVSALLSAMEAITKLRGEEFDPNKVKHMRLVASLVAGMMDSKRLSELAENVDRRSFLHYIRLAIASAKIAAAFGAPKEIFKGLKNALERSLLSIYVEGLPLLAVDILDGLSSVYAYLKPDPVTVREIVGYMRRMPTFELILEVTLRLMRRRFEELGYADLAEICS